MTETQRSTHMSTSLVRLAMLGRDHPQRCFTNLNQYLTRELLEATYHQTRKDGAVGIDGQTAKDFAKDLKVNLESLLQRAKDGSYFAPPVRRAYIPKGSSHRPIGIPTFEDKVLQRAIVMILEKLYGPIFHTHSYGYRPNRSAHQALENFRRQIDEVGYNIIELDIQTFFDNLDKEYLRKFLQQRIGDGVILRLINKWLKAGVIDAGCIHYPESGTPQGGVISLILANVYLHYVLDVWFEQEVKRRLINRASFIRFADDAVLVFRNEKDSHKLMKVLPKRFARFNLTLHPEKTYQKVFHPRHKVSIDFLGFTHFWKRSRKGNWGISRKTMKAKFARGIQSIKHWCQHNRHLSVVEQYIKLSQKVRGHYAYFGISGNADALGRFRHCVQRVWIKWLRRRSQKHRLNWDNAKALLARYKLPIARIKPRNWQTC